AVLMGPVVPFLSDSPAQLEATVRQAAQAGARSVTPIVLHLRTGAREWFFRWLHEHHPELVPRYLALYGRGAYAPQAYQERVGAQVGERAEGQGVGGDRPGGCRPAASTLPGGSASRQDVAPRWRARGGSPRTNGVAGSAAEPVQLPLL